MRLSLDLDFPGTLQSDIGLAFQAKLTQGVSKALEIKYHLYCAWRPQSSGKVEGPIDYSRDTCLSWLKKITSPGKN
jgi:hypothetical protein